MLIILVILGIIILILVIKIVLLKHTIKIITREMLKGDYQNAVTFPLHDKDVIELGKVINAGIDSHNKQLVEIRKKELVLKDMVLNISHDLRTPLTAMIGYVRLLQQNDLEKQNERYVNIIMRKSEDLKQLVSNFYELSLIESTESEPLYQEINLVEMLTDYLLVSADLLEERHIEPQIIVINDIPNINADELMLGRILNNLVVNATKYSKGSLNIYIEKKEFVEVIFENDTEEVVLETDKIFEKFYTGDNARRNGNTGLGLYIAKKLMNKMDGEMVAKMSGDKLQIILNFKKNLL